MSAWMILDAFNGPCIKDLGINDTVNQAFVHHVAHGLCDAAEGKAHMDAVLSHMFGKNTRRGKGSAARTCLV